MKAARRRFLQIMTGAVASPAISRFAMAETYPVRPVHLVVPVPPGGTFDIVGRLVAAALSERLGQQVVVDNRDGVATAIGTGFVAHAQPDGYTLLLAGSPAAINETLYPNLDFRFHKGHRAGRQHRARAADHGGEHLVAAQGRPGVH